MTGRQSDDPVAAARRLTASLDGVRDELKTVNQSSEERDKALAKYGRRNRILIIIAIISTLLDISATTVAVVSVVIAQNARTTASANQARVEAEQASNIAACLAGNVTRAAEVSLWEHVVAVAPPQNAAQKVTSDQFLAYVRRTFAPRNCQAAYRTPG